MSLFFSKAEIRQYIRGQAIKGVILTPAQASAELDNQFLDSIPKPSETEPKGEVPVQYEDQYGHQRWTHNGSRV